MIGAELIVVNTDLTQCIARAMAGRYLYQRVRVGCSRLLSTGLGSGRERVFVVGVGMTKFQKVPQCLVNYSRDSKNHMNRNLTTVPSSCYL